MNRLRWLLAGLGLSLALGLVAQINGQINLSGLPSIANNTFLANGSGVTTFPTAIGALNALAILNSPACNAQSGATYTLVLGDANGCVTMSNATANTLTVPANASVAFPVGTTITVQQLGAGITTISPAGSVTFESAQYGSSTSISYTLIGAYDFAQFKQVAANTWVLSTLGPGRSAPTTSGPVFTYSSGTGACATTSTLVGGSIAGSLVCTGTTGASTLTLALPAVGHGYVCYGRDVTTPTTVTQTGAVSTTAVVLTLTSVTANDVVQFGCPVAY